MNLGILNRFSLVLDILKAEENESLANFQGFFQMSKEHLSGLVKCINIILHSFSAAFFLPYSTFDVVGHE